MSVIAIVLAVAVLSLAADRVTALTKLIAPAGSKVGLAFLDPVDTGKVKPGNKIRFRTDANTKVKGRIVIRKGTRLTGTVTKAGHRFLLRSGYVTISNLAVTTVDGKVVGLNDVRVKAPLFHRDIRVKPGTHMRTTTKKDVAIVVQ
ncbi:MAG TPA: hypothetical protein VHQ03_06720 [Candidatus Dormibacteraeota bacterium]|nr:hypothetical protein [Candidatus Dormibacteraeota bacterium]